MPYLEFLLRLGSALLLGTLVGLERQWQQREQRPLSCAGFWCGTLCMAKRRSIQQSGVEQELTYLFEVSCRIEDEAHRRALFLQGMANKSLMLTSLASEDLEGTPKLKVLAVIRGLGRQDQALEHLVARLSLEAGVPSVSWAVRTLPLE